MSGKEKIHNFKDEAQTIRFARKLGAELAGGEVIELIGDIGSGKTTFVKGLAEGAGYKGGVTSPTFTIQQIYEGRISIYHYDFYRLDDPGIMAREIEETLENENAAAVVEWAETVNGVLPADRIKIRIKPTGEKSRDVSVETPKTVDRTKP